MSFLFFTFCVSGVKVGYLNEHLSSKELFLSYYCYQCMYIRLPPNGLDDRVGSD